MTGDISPRNDVSLRQNIIFQKIRAKTSFPRIGTKMKQRIPKHFAPMQTVLYDSKGWYSKRATAWRTAATTSVIIANKQRKWTKKNIGLFFINARIVKFQESPNTLPQCRQFFMTQRDDTVRGLQPGSQLPLHQLLLKISRESGLRRILAYFLSKLGS